VVDTSSINRNKNRNRKLVFELTDTRNALERVLLHFAHFEKTVEKIDENKYLVKIKYDKDDETEMVIRILSFGPMIRVTAPSSFIKLIKQRLLAQKSCEL
jgi:predicted DNA-binding transcriptional regulator YafY